MRLLAITNEYPFPPRTGGAIVAANHLVRLAAKHSVRLICLRALPEGDESQRHFEAVETMGRVDPDSPNRNRWLRGLASLEPAGIYFGRSEALNDRISALWKSGEYDAIVLFELRVLQYCPKDSLERVVVNIEDPQALRLLRMAMLPVFAKQDRLVLTIEAAVYYHYEHRTLGRVGRVLLLSERDSRRFARMHRLANVSWVPYGVELPDDSEVPGFDARIPGRIVITGNMFHPPNVDGVLVFLRDVFPLVLRREPSANLLIVGARPDPRIIEASKPLGDRVEVTGVVPSVSDYLRSARVSVCPIRLGFGVQTKILEALSWGTPVVTTPEGNSGIGGASGVHLWIENKPNQMADRIVDTLRGAQWNALSRGARAHVRTGFDWQRSVSLLERHLETVVLGRSAAGRAQGWHGGREP